MNPYLLAVSLLALSVAHVGLARAQSQDDPIETEESAPVAGYERGFFIRSSDGPYELRLQTRLQARYSHEFVEDDADESAFSIRRARLTLGGVALTEALRYKLQIAFDRGSVALKDFYFDYEFCDALRLRIGQWKRPFSRQQMNSSGRLSLVDRAITDGFFGAGRDIGLAIHNGYEDSPRFEYALGFFNGTGESPEFTGDVMVDTTTGEGDVIDGSFSNVPDHFHPMLVFRIGYNHGDNVRGYREVDLEGGPPRFGVGLSGQADFDADGGDDGSLVAELDYIFKAYGFSTSAVLYVATAQDGTSFWDQDFAAWGFHLEASYVIAGRIQPGVRYARISADEGEDTLQEILGGLSIYFFDHSFKWQTDAGALMADNPTGSSRDIRVRTQVQVAF